MGVKLVSASAGSVEIVAPATASNFITTMPAGNGTVVVGGVNSAITSGTVAASTSGTGVDFTGIPSWIKRVTVMIVGVSTNGVSPLRLQVGAGSIQTSGYLGYNLQFSNTGVSGSNISSGFDFSTASGETSSAVRHGSIVFNYLGNNTWVLTGSLGLSNTVYGALTSGSVALSGTLDRVRITTVGGTDTFDAGSINILYE